MALLGSPRLTVDIDFVSDDVYPNPLHRAIMEIAKELKIHVEPVPLDRFVPLPKGSAERSYTSVNLAIWKYTLLAHTVLRLANWIVDLS